MLSFMLSGQPHGQSDTPGKFDRFCIWEVGDTSINQGQGKKLLLLLLTTGTEQDEWIWKMLQRDCQLDLIQCQNEGIRKGEK